MSYTRPLHGAADATWEGAANPYVMPSAASADATWLVLIDVPVSGTASQFASSAVTVAQVTALFGTGPGAGSSPVEVAAIQQLGSLASITQFGGLRVRDANPWRSVLLSDDIALDRSPLYALTENALAELVEMEVVLHDLYPRQIERQLFTRKPIEVLYVEEEQWQAQ